MAVFCCVNFRPEKHFSGKNPGKSQILQKRKKQREKEIKRNKTRLRAHICADIYYIANAWELMRWWLLR